MSRGRQGAGSLGESKFRRGVGGRRSEERVRCGSSIKTCGKQEKWGGLAQSLVFCG